MLRRSVAVVLLAYVGLSTWTITSRFVTFGDGVSVIVGVVMSHQDAQVRDAAPGAGGIDFIECFGCDPLPGAEGLPLTLLALVAVGTPLALRAFATRRRARTGLSLPDSGVAQIAAVLMAASLVVSTWMGPLLLAVRPYDAGSLVWPVLGAMGIANVVLGVPALYAWREVYARAFGRATRFLPRD